jgi:hypothetical protein
MERKSQLLKKFAWKLSAAAAVTVFVAWGQGIRWQFSNLSTYDVFPLFGLLAFSLIWSMYMVGFFRRRLNADGVGLSVYYKSLGYVVLAAIALHPGLLWWQLWRDGFGLPPKSYLEHYVAPTLKWAVILGTLGWLVFLVYELRHRLSARSWWKYMEIAADAAMVALFIHALRLGGEMNIDWFRMVWYFYGATLALVLIDNYRRKLFETV